MKTYKYLIASFFLLIPALSVAVPSTQLAAKPSSIQAIVNQYLAKYKSNDTQNKGEYISAIQVSVYNNGIVKTYVAGNTKHQSGVPITEKNLFAWGSITKEFTAAVILQLQDRGKLDLNQTLGQTH